GEATEIDAEPNGPTALRFIKKPFAVDRFTMLVRTSLDLTSGSSRTLRNLVLVDLLVLEAIAGATAVLQVDSADGRTGEIHFAEGRISHALVVGKIGVNALVEMLSWIAPRVREVDRRSDAPRTIRGPWSSVLRDALRQAREMPNEPSRPAAAAPQPTPAGKKILVVDDTELLLIFVDEILSTADPTLQIVTASRGTSGAEKAASEKPDLILLDYSLPDITGGEVCRRLLANESTAHIPVIMMSGHVPEMLTVAERYGNVIATIAKPFVSSALIELLTHTLANLAKITVPKAAKKTSAPKPEPRKPKPTNSHKQHPAENKEQPPPVGKTAEPSSEAEVVSEEGEIPPAQPPPPAASAAPAAEEPPSEESQPSEPSDVPPPNEEPPPPSDVLLEEEPAREPAVTTATETQLAPRAVVSPAARNAVVVTFPLEVLSIQFSASLAMRAIRARPFSPQVSLHVLPQTTPGVVIPEASFDLSRVDLNARGQIDIIRVTPTSTVMAAIESSYAISLVGVSVLRASSGPAVELIPAPAAARLRLTALFELVGVELSAGFRVGHLVLQWRGGKMRVTQEADTPRPGVIFETAQVLLDREARIAEFLLEAIA
ncbi:MAG TPA: response regulator, partial [Chthoniobacterales bacterium]